MTSESIAPNTELLRIRDVAIAFGGAWIKNRIGHLGTGKERPVFQVRDSLIYRSWSVHWHVSQLKHTLDAFALDLQNRYAESLDSPQLLMEHQHIAHYLFDDIVFNCASMFDYVGNLVGLAYMGPTSPRLKWNPAAKAAHDKKSDIHSTPVAKVLLETHNEWVNPLFEYRGNTIHHKVELGAASHTLGSSDTGIDARIEVSLPEQLSKRLLHTRDRVEILEGAVRIVDVSAKRCNDILSCMTNTLVPKYLT